MDDDRDALASFNGAAGRPLEALGLVAVLVAISLSRSTTLIYLIFSR